MATRQSARKTSGRKAASRKAPGRKAPVAATAGSAARRAASPLKSPRPGAQAATSAPRASTQPRSAKAAKGTAGPAARRRKPAGRHPAPGAPRDALALLKQDHDDVDQMFRKYERMKGGDERKSALRGQIIEALTVHAQVEEELFYPALRSLFEAAEKDKAVELIDEADVEHETLKWLIEQLEGGDQADEGMTDARVKVLGEYVKHHVKEEEGEIFKAARKVALDLADLGRQMDARKRQLKGEESAESEAGGEASLQVTEPAQMASGRSES